MPPVPAPFPLPVMQLPLYIGNPAFFFTLEFVFLAFCKRSLLPVFDPPHALLTTSISANTVLPVTRYQCGSIILINLGWFPNDSPISERVFFSPRTSTRQNPF